MMQRRRCGVGGGDDCQRWMDGWPYLSSSSSPPLRRLQLEEDRLAVAAVAAVLHHQPSLSLHRNPNS